MTNARQSRRQRNRAERLIAHRNALLDVLNGILNYSLAVNGRAEMLLEHSYMIGQKRHVVELDNTPEGLIIRQRRDLVFNAEAKTEADALLVMPNLDEYPV